MVGAQLQAARRAQQIPLATVTEATKIQTWVLEALEADRLQELMSPIYAKGFLTTYARFLRLDPAPLLAEVPWPTPEPVTDALPPASPAFLLMRQVPSALLRWVGRPLVIAGVVAALVALKPLQWLSRISPAGPAPPTAARQGPPRHTAPKLASVTPVSEPANLPTTAELAALHAAAPLELVVTAHQSTWIKLVADGRLVTQQRLPRGANERWTAQQQFAIIISKPTQVELTLNGQSISPFAVAHRGRVLITRRGVTRLPDEE